MNRRRRIYEGKAKILYEGPEPGTLIQHFKDDATAFNNKKHDKIEGKGVLNNRISEYLFVKLSEIGVPTHFIKRLNMREQLIREVEIIPLEVVVRNVAAGSLATRIGVDEGTALPRSIVEFYYKSDKLGDPMVTEEHITAFGWANPQELDDIMSLALRINDFLSGLFLGVGIRLVDFKCEFGRLRVQTRTALSRLHERLGTTTIYVTHDQVEAVTLGDRIAVMRAGRIQQVGTPTDLYEHPVNLFVAGFIGSPAMNFLPGQLDGDQLRTPIGDLRLAGEMCRRLEAGDGGGRRGVIVGIRPEHFEDAMLVTLPATGHIFKTKIEVLEALGSDSYAHFTVDSPRISSSELEELADETSVASSAEGVRGRRSPRCGQRNQAGTGGPALGRHVSATPLRSRDRPKPADARELQARGPRVLDSLPPPAGRLAR